MEREIPIEVRKIQEEYLAAQKAQEAIKQAEKKPNPKKQARMEAKLRKPMRSREFESIARKYQATCEGNRGKHGVHVVFSNGQELPVPKHTGTLSPGVQRNLVNSLRENQIISIGA